MGLNKNQIDDIMKMVEGAGASKQKSLPSLAMPKTASDGLDSQIKNLDIRLGSIGQDTSQLKDPRSGIEKALNLTQDQNILFDLFEVINRPQQAIFGSIIAAQKGEDVGQGFMEGLTGKADEHYGGDIIRNTLGRTEDGKIDWTDFAGFALDIFLDPADLGLALVTGGASTVVSAVDAGADTTKLLKTGAKAKEAMDVARKSNALDMAQNILLGKGNRLYVPDSVPEYLQIMFDKKYRQSLGIQTISVTDSIFRTGASGIKVGGAFADSIVETTLGKVDDEMLQGYKHFKNQFSETMKSTAGGVRKAMTAARERILRGHDMMAVEFRDFDDAVKKYAEKTGKDLATANREILHLYEYMKLPEKNFTEYQFLKEVFDAKVPFFRYDDNTLKQLKEIFGEDIINESTKRATHAVAGHQFDVIEFDKNYWSMDNTDLADRFYEAENRSIRLLSEGETIKYENILRQKDPEAFATYEKLRKDFNNETLLQRIDLEYDNRFPYGTKKRHASLEDANKAKKKIEDSLRKRMVKEGVGAEAFLKDKVDFSEVADDIMDKQTMDFLKSDMDAETEYYYNLALKEDKRYIDMLVSKKYPTSNAPTDPVELVAYNKKRNKYAAELRASRSSFPYSEKVLKEAQEGTLQKEGLFQFKSAEDVKNFSGDVDSLPESMRKEFKALKKQGDTLQKVRESVTTDTLLEKSRKYKNAIKKYDDMAEELLVKYGQPAEDFGVADEGINPGLINIFDESIYSIVDPIKLNENALYENNVEVVEGFDGIKKSGAILPDGRILSANEHEQIAKALTGDDNSIKVFKEKGITYFGLGERSFDRSVTIVSRPTQEQLKAIQSAFDSFSGGGGKFTVIFQLDDMEEIAKIDLPFAESANLDLEIRKLMKKSPSLGGLDESIKAMQLPKTAGVRANQELRDIIRNSQYGATELAQDRNLTDWVVNHPEIDPNEVIENMEDIWYETRLIDGQKALKPITLDEAKELLFENIGQSIYDGWYRNADSAYKPKIVRAILNNPEAYNASMNVMWENYKTFNNVNISFEDFLNTEIPLYRAHDKAAISKDVFSSYTLDKAYAERLSKNRGEMLTIKVKPKDTLGMFNTVSEFEVLVPTKPLSRLNLSDAPAKTVKVPPKKPVRKIRPELSEPKINIKKWYTDEQIEAFEMLKKDTELLGMVDQFGNVIRKTQEIIGEVEFGDAQALVRRSMAGYAPHVQSAETKAIWDKIKKEATKHDVQGYFAPGNLRELSQRGYNMSTLEANNVKQMYNKAMWENDEWFQENVPDEMRDMVEEFFETDGFSESASESLLGLMNAKFTAINRNKRTTDMLIAMSMGDPDGKSSAIKYISDSEATPRGFERLREAEVRKLKKTLNETRELAGDGYYLNKLIHTAERGLNQGTEVVMEKHLYRMLNIMDKNPVTALNVLDKFHSLYKLLKTSNPISFNGKNFIGNNTNMWLSGINVPDIITNWNRAHDYVTKYTNQIKPLLASGGKLTDEQAKIAQYMEDMLQNGYFNLDSIYKLNDMEAIIEENIGEVGKKVRKNPLDNPLTNANMSANLWVDNHARMALYIYAKENPEYLAKLGFDPLDPKSAMNAVRMVLFDPKDLSLWEEDWMKRLIPFYTFTRQNLAFQVKNIAKNSSRYYKMYKGLNSVYNASDIDVDDVNSFERTQFYLPVFGQKDGKYVAVKTSVPFAALMEFGEDPVGRFVGSTSPVIKGVFENATGSSAFTGRPIENYAGEPSTNIPGATKKDEWYMSQVGVDIPARTAGGLVDLVKNLIKGEDPTQSLSRATGMFYAGDIEKAKMAKQYEKLNALNDRVKTLKAQGQAVPTLSEITASISKPESSDKMAQMKQIMDMIKQVKR